MGRILFIRVSAVTFDEKDVVKAWPALCATVWPDPELDGVTSAARLARKLAPAVGRGVLELADGLTDMMRFGNVPKEWKAALEGPAGRLEEVRRYLDQALSDRNAQKAYALTDDIEKALDEAEQAVRTLKRMN